MCFIAVANTYADDIKLTDANATLVRLTTADGYTGKDVNKANYYYGHLDERRVTWSVGRDLILSPK